MAGINRAIASRGFALASINESFDFRKNSVSPPCPCFFISHLSVNKNVAISVGDYILNHADIDIDIYLDIYDEELQRAVRDGDPHKITKSIETGITNSSHIICLVSEKTSESWWVPYELGFAKKSQKEISSLILKDATYIPDYLQIGAILRGTVSLNKYLKVVTDIHNSNTAYAKVSPSFIPETQIPHPLDSCLSWEI